MAEPALLEERCAAMAGRVARPGRARLSGAGQSKRCRRCGGALEREQLGGAPHLFCACCNSIAPDTPRPRPAEGYEPAERRDLDG